MGSDSQGNGGSLTGHTFINMLRVTMGMGLLTMPSAIARVGIIPAFLIAGIIPFLSFFTWTWAVAIKEKLDGQRQPAETDPLWKEEAATEAPEAGLTSAEKMIDDAARAAMQACLGGFDVVVQDVLGATARLAFIVCSVGVGGFGGISFISAVVEGLQVMFPGLTQNVGLLLVGGALMVTTVAAPDLENIAFLSLASTLLLIYVFVSMPLEGIHNRHHAEVQRPLLWDPSAGLLDWGFTYGAIGCSYGGIAIGLCLYADMKHKEDYAAVTGATFTCSAVVAMIFGCLGYWAFGGDINPIVYLNFTPGSTTSYICIVSYNLILLFSYLLIMTPAFLLARSWLPSVPYVVTRLSMILATMLASKVMPSMMQIWLLTVLVCTQVSELMIPSLCYLRKGDRYSTGQRGIAYLCLAVSLVGGSLGFMSAVKGNY